MSECVCVALLCIAEKGSRYLRLKYINKYVFSKWSFVFSSFACFAHTKILLFLTF